MRPSPESPAVVPSTPSTSITPSHFSGILVNSSSCPSIAAKQRAAPEEERDSPLGGMRSHYPPPPSVKDVPDEDDVPIESNRFSRLNSIEKVFNGGGGWRGYLNNWMIKGSYIRTTVRVRSPPYSCRECETHESVRY